MAKERFRKIKQKTHKTQTAADDNLQKKPYPFASASTKLKAFLTDTFMLMMPIMYIVTYLVIGSLQAFAHQRLLGWAYILVPLLIIQTLFMGISAQTPGYRAYDLKVIDIHTGEKPSWGVLLFRNTLAVLSALTFVGWIIMFFRKDARTLHDILSATAVIKTQ